MLSRAAGRSGGSRGGWYGACLLAPHVHDNFTRSCVVVATLTRSIKSNYKVTSWGRFVHSRLHPSLCLLLIRFLLSPCSSLPPPSLPPSLPPSSPSAQRSGDLRLAGYGASRLAGRLEIYLNEQWGTVCTPPHDSLYITKVACRQLGLGHFVGHVPGAPLLR